MLEGKVGQLETDLDAARQEVEEAMFTDAPESPSQLGRCQYLWLCSLVSLSMFTDNCESEELNLLFYPFWLNLKFLS